MAINALIGVVLALFRAGMRWAIVASAAAFCAAILRTYWDVLLRDPAHWPRNLMEGVLHTGLFSLVCDAFPVLLGYGVTRWARARTAQS